MNPILILCILLAAGGVWILLAPIFETIGAVVADLARQFWNAINGNDIDDLK